MDYYENKRIEAELEELDGLLGSLSEIVEVEEPEAEPVSRAISSCSAPFIERDHDALRAELDRLLSKVKTGRIKTAYNDVRKEILNIGMKLNEKSIFAPRFRGMPTPPHKCISLDEIALSIDRQIIDMHWLYLHGHRIVINDDECALLFNQDIFDSGLAEKLAGRQWSAVKKAELLQLTPEQQWELASIQSGDVRKRWNAIQHGEYAAKGQLRTMGADQVRVQLNGSCATRPGDRAHVEGWVIVWMASKVACHIAGEKKVSPGLLARVYCHMTGLPSRDPQGVMRKLKAVESRLTKK